jgi:hypothetical protein
MVVEQAQLRSLRATITLCFLTASVILCDVLVAKEGSRDGAIQREGMLIMLPTHFCESMSLSRRHVMRYKLRIISIIIIITITFKTVLKAKIVK